MLMWSVAVLLPALPGRNAKANGSPVPCLAVVDERAQRMMPEALLIRRGCVFFLRVRGHQRGIEVDDQRILSADVMVGGVLTGMGPRDLAGGGAGGVDCP